VNNPTEGAALALHRSTFYLFFFSEKATWETFFTRVNKSLVGDFNEVSDSAKNQTGSPIGEIG
jgi:hypothetical protein